MNANQVTPAPFTNPLEDALSCRDSMHVISKRGALRSSQSVMDSDDEFSDDDSFGFSDDDGGSTASASDLSGLDDAAQCPIEEVEKRVTFAMSKGRLMDQVFTYPNENRRSMWWSKDELVKTRQECAFHVNHIKASELNYEISLETLAASNDEADPVSEDDISSCIKELVDLSVARGLERHIVQSIYDMSTMHQDAVLDAQDRIDRIGILDTDKGQTLLRNFSEDSSKQARQLALKLAEFDTHEAYRAVLGPWIGTAQLKQPSPRNKHLVAREA